MSNANSKRKQETHLTFELGEQKPKTKTWNVLSKHDHTKLGSIKFRGAWRQYCFYPTQEYETFWSGSCIGEINRFLDICNYKHKQKEIKKTEQKKKGVN